MDFVCALAHIPITDAAFAAAARDLDCDIAAVKAVAQVESRAAPFLKDGRPTILFERHKFRQFSNGRFCASHPHLSGPRLKRGEYGGLAEQYDKLTAAMALHDEAAFKSASWGAFQIMGFNHRACGFDDVDDFVSAMVHSADRHLAAFVGFILTNGLDRHLRRLDWAKFARGYNGPAFRDNDYDGKMARAYAAFAAEPRPAPPPIRAAAPTPRPFRIETVRDLQTALDYLGIPPGPIDNMMGPKTVAAIRRLQRFAQLDEDGRFSAEVRAAAQSAYHMMKRFDALEQAA